MTRLAAIAAGILVVASCDTRLPTTAVIGSSSSGGKDLSKPAISIDSPTVNALINIGDSILVVMKLHDDKALSSVVVSGLAYRGSADLGTLTQRVRYGTITIPVSGIFRTGLRDTTVRRYLKQVAADTTADSLIVQVIARDSIGNADTTYRRVDLVFGPKVTIPSPLGGDSVPAGVGLSVSAKAAQPDGIAQMSIRVQGETNWPNRLDTTVTQAVSGAPREATISSVARIPVTAPVRSKITITASAVDVNGRPGSSQPTIVYVRSANTAQPRVTQTVLPRSELGDSIKIQVTGDGIRSIGYVARDSVGAVIKRDSVLLAQPYAGNVNKAMVLDGFSPSFQGKKIAITSFAVDQAGRTGYAVRSTQITPEPTLANGLVDSTLIVYGRTFTIPRSGTGNLIGDIAIDVTRGNVILSNTDFNRLEVWQNTSRQFDPIGVAVGSLPWGLFISNNPDTLLVANSGGTNISRVFIGSTSVRSIREDSLHRILTRGTYLFVVNETRDAQTGKVTITSGPPIIFSDRPQYIGQIKSGEIYFSTRPTPNAPQGTIRYIDPKQAVPDPKPILIIRNTVSDLTNYVIVNADSVFIRRALVSTTAPDTLVMYDHPPGTLLPSDSVRSTVGVGAAVAALRALNGSDVSFVQGVDVSNVGTSDTTYVAISGDRRWIAFGEGGSAATGTIMMSTTGFFSPPITQVDLTNNASERVNGLALDSTGTTMAAHGGESFFAAVDVPFHLRLQGKYQSFAPGAGITFHPRAKGITSPDQFRTAFVSSANQTIEIIDIFHYINRGRLPLKGSLYGPLRATVPLPGDAPDIILKLFGVTADGLVVIDLRAGDILPIP